MASRAVGIIRRLYGNELRPRKGRGLLDRLLGPRSSAARDRRGKMLDLYRVRKKLVTRGRLLVASCLVLIAAVAVVSAYYYNTLTRYEQDVYMERAKIDSLLQRRRNISINLARTVRDYAAHERGIFNHVSDVRAASQGAGAAARALPAEQGPLAVDSGPGDWLDEILRPLLIGSGPLPAGGLAKLLAVAERYPDLKLSDNFQRLMGALVEMEKELSAGRMTYSEVVNRYSTQLMTFPGNLFARIYGFASLPYYEADAEARRFRPIDY